jgi:hypothetical protein
MINKLLAISLILFIPISSFCLDKNTKSRNKIKVYSPNKSKYYEFIGKDDNESCTSDNYFGDFYCDNLCPLYIKNSKNDSIIKVIDPIKNKAKMEIGLKISLWWYAAIGWYDENSLLVEPVLTGSAQPAYELGFYDINTEKYTSIVYYWLYGFIVSGDEFCNIRYKNKCYMIEFLKKSKELNIYRINKPEYSPPEIINKIYSKKLDMFNLKMKPNLSNLIFFIVNNKYEININTDTVTLK